MTAQRGAPPNWAGTASALVAAAAVARKDGMLAMEQQAKEVSDPFLEMAYQLLADAPDPAVMREILWAKIESEHHEMKEYAEIFEKMGGFAPTMGIIGTVMGLTHALQLLNEPTKLGPAIAGAFMATFYGVSSANLLFTPTSDRLKGLGKERKEYRGMIVAAVMSIQRGDSPRQVAEKLASMSPVELDADDMVAATKGSGGA
jgi:chemotaxis protein MotA